MNHNNAPMNLGNGHLDTLLPYLFRPVKKQTYQRERIETPDNDFLDLDWVKGSHRKLLIISHGLESSSKAQYVQGMADLFKQQGFDVLAWNYRGCSGAVNRTMKYYHSGASEDLATVVEHVQSLQAYDSVFLMGFSLGGNLTLKYAGEQSDAIAEAIKGVCVFSTPCYLKTASHQLAKGFNKIYTQNFVRSLKQKVYDKRALLEANGFDLADIDKLNSLPTFDDVFTAPMHGFKDADDYYQQCSATFFMPDIRVPTLIVNAANDPFLSKECYPYQLVDDNPCLQMEVPKHGGHVGFYQPLKGNVMWSEARALAFVQSLL